ncbi:hypothetical protein BV25DRAFT_1990967 [Artomyces pyxidatus]|uniref:Uncharacterized protein n=1 Tax=Artomyces pyxidatus TaxID=48021 RepID=A0ACB8T5A9_9AGAM|nr:hypothetical protein BV25DRAFT_1990967 [Artomyces pyxidatus]
MAASPLPADRGDIQMRDKWANPDEQVVDSSGDASASNGGPVVEDRERAGGPTNPESGSTVYREKEIKVLSSSLAFVLLALRHAPNKVYIGGLPENTRQEDLQSCFGKIGNIINIELKVGYGFVEFETREAAEESVAKYNEGHFMGNKIRVELSHGGGRYAKYRGDPGACFKCGEMGHWARECPNHVVQAARRPAPAGDAPLIDRIHPTRDFLPPPPPRDYPAYREEYPPRNYAAPTRDMRYPYEYAPPRRPLSPPRDYRDYPVPAPPPRRGDVDDYRARGPPPPPPRYEARAGYYPPDDAAAYPRGYPPPPPRDYDRYDRRPPPPGDRYAPYPPPTAARPRTPPGGAPPLRAREDFERPPVREYLPPAGDYRRPVTPPTARYVDYPPRGGEGRVRRRSQSPPHRAPVPAAYDSYPPPGPSTYAGAPAAGPPKGGARDYPPPPPRGGRDVVEANGGYRRP